MRHPAAFHMIVPVTLIGLPAIHHLIMKQIVMAGSLPYARVHNDTRLDAHHLEPARCPLGLIQLIVRGDHIAPPRLLDVTLQFHPQRAVIPQTTEAPVNFGGLKHKPAAFTQRHNRIHQGIIPCHEAASVSGKPPKKSTKHKKAALGLNRSSTAGRLPILFASAPERAFARRSMPLVGHLPSDRPVAVSPKGACRGLGSASHTEIPARRREPRGLLPKKLSVAMFPREHRRRESALPEEGWVTFPLASEDSSGGVASPWSVG